MQELTEKRIPGKSKIKILGLLGKAMPTPVGLMRTGFVGTPEEQARPIRQIPLQVGNPWVVTRRLDQPAGARPEEAVRLCIRLWVSREAIREIPLHKPQVDNGDNFLNSPSLQNLTVYFPPGTGRI